MQEAYSYQSYGPVYPPIGNNSTPLKPPLGYPQSTNYGGVHQPYPPPSGIHQPYPPPSGVQQPYPAEGGQFQTLQHSTQSGIAYSNPDASNPPQNTYQVPNNKPPNANNQRTRIYLPEFTHPKYVKSHPTLLPVDDYTPKMLMDDTNNLIKALRRRFYCDKELVTSVLVHRSYKQRESIANNYWEMNLKELKVQFQYRLHFKYKDLILALLSPYDFVAGILDASIRGWNRHESDLIHIICTATNSEMIDIKVAYGIKYNVTLEKNIMGYTSGFYRNFLLSLIQAKREENPNFIVDVAKYDAYMLHCAYESRNVTDLGIFINIFSMRSVYHLQQVIIEYQNFYSDSLENAIEKVFSGPIMTALVTVVRYVRDKYTYFATHLYNIMADVLRKDKMLIHTVVTRCEIDLGDIKTAFYAEYKIELINFIQKNTSGKYYQPCLMELIKG